MDGASTIEGKSYVILGATGGIGSDVARKLAAQGANLVVGGRDAERLGELARTLDVRPYRLDATTSGEVDSIVSATVDAYGRLDGIVNCVGSMLLKPAHLTSDEEWDETLTVNLKSAFSAVRAGARAMMKTGGSIVLVSSAAARVGLANHEAIGAAKAGVIGLVLSAAATYARAGIRVNAVAPGMVRTPLTAHIVENEHAERASVAMHPSGRLGEPSDISSAITWLLSPEASWVNGQVFGVDGGLSTVRARVKV